MTHTCEVSRTWPGTATGLEAGVALHSPLCPPEAKVRISRLRALGDAAEMLCTLTFP